MDHYENDFEALMLKDTSAYYSREASNQILADSCLDYMVKSERLKINTSMQDKSEIESFSQRNFTK
ncbi:unnamed protein product [Lupinus luteus]|uniref:Uncharacterized protein n=1 Tax=Lupinus luteus TaxID=3873 RepID=A0AAV1XA63_LUPLU